MKSLYNELLEREKQLMSLEQTEKVKAQLKELRVVILRVQQRLLDQVPDSKKNDNPRP